MSETPLSNAAALAEEAAIRLCWSQWRSMGSMGSPTGDRRAHAIIDPEALILLSLYCRDSERRLMDMVVWWAEVGSRLTSVQRLRRVAEGFPGQAGTDALALFASVAAEAGDRRWKKHASAEIPTWVRPSKGPDQPMLIESSALWPRLRAGFGVGAKADTLAFLLGLRGAWASASVIAYATGYSPVAVRQAAGEMALAHLIRETEGRPTEYTAPARQWADLLELVSGSGGGGSPPQLPPWRFWSQIAAFLVGVMECRRSAADDLQRPHVLASRARDLVEAHSRAFKLNDIAVPPVRAFPGLEMFEGLTETVRALAEWMENAA